MAKDDKLPLVSPVKQPAVVQAVPVEHHRAWHIEVPDVKVIDGVEGMPHARMTLMGRDTDNEFWQTTYHDHKTLLAANEQGMEGFDLDGDELSYMGRRVRPAS